MPLQLQIAQRKALDEAVAALGRDPQSMGIVWQQPCVVAETEREATAHRELLLTAIPAEGAGVYLSHNAGYDFSTLPRAVHAWRAAPRDRRQPGLAGRLRARAGDAVRRRQPRSPARNSSSTACASRPATTRTVAGTAAQVADHLEEVFEATGSRGGFMLGHVVSMPRDLDAIVDLLVPELQRRGRFRREYKAAPRCARTCSTMINIYVVTSAKAEGPGRVV